MSRRPITWEEKQDEHIASLLAEVERLKNHCAALEYERYEYIARAVLDYIRRRAGREG